MTRFIKDEELYKEVIERVDSARRFVWIGTTDKALIESVMNQFDDVWMGKFCKTCGRRTFCSDSILFEMIRPKR